MPERDGYIPGVPCWVDTSQPDPEAAADFYSGLFGWEVENVMPPGVAGASTSSARIRGLDVGAIGSIPEGAPPMAMWNTYIWVDSADDTAAKVRDAGGRSLMEPFDVMDAGRHGRLRRSRGRGPLRLAGQAAQGRAVVNEHGALNFNSLQHPRRRAREGVLRRRVRMGRARPPGRRSRCGRCPATATTCRADPDLREHMAELGAPEGFMTSSRRSSPIPADQTDVPPHWSVTFGVDDADAAAAQGDRARRQRDRAAVRRAVGADDRARRPGRRNVHREQVRAGERRPRHGGRRGQRSLAPTRTRGQVFLVARCGKERLDPSMPLCRRFVRA